MNALRKATFLLATALVLTSAIGAPWHVHDADTRVCPLCQTERAPEPEGDAIRIVLPTLVDLGSPQDEQLLPEADEPDSPVQGRAPPVRV